MKYNVGDKVLIKDIGWYNENKDKYGTIYTSNGFCFCDDMTKHCGDIMKIIDIIVDPKDSNQGYYIMDNVKKWTDEMIEGLAEDECPQDFIEKYCNSCGTQRCDRTKEYLNGCPYYNAYMCIKQNNDMEEGTKPKPKFKVGDRVITNKGYIGKFEGWVSDYQVRVLFEESGCNVVIHPKDLKLVEEETKPNIIEEAKTYWDSIKDAWICPEGYIFKDENGNIINATKIVLEKKKKEYPKTYEECCKVLGVNPDNFLSIRNLYRDDGDEESTDYERDLLGKFDSLWELRICRDAYWKIAGEEMGLGKPWEPDYSEESYEQGSPIKYVIYYTGNNITKGRMCTPSYILSFPTEKMRDDFYEAFRKKIEICKELL